MLLHSPADENNGVISPDGRWLAYNSDESGRDEVYVRPFPGVETARQQVSTGGGTRPLWSRAGRELFYYVAPDTIMAVPVRLGTDVVLGRPAVVIKGPYAVAAVPGRHYDVSVDGQRFLLLKDATSPNTRQAAEPELRVALNWFEELKAKVPTTK
jgi:serine/threonine-protein kinase